jgi:hypothetical protein
LWQDWLTLVVPYGGYTKTVPGLFSPSSVWNQSVNGFSTRLLVDPQTAVRVAPGAARLLAYGVCAALFGAEMLLTWRLRAVQAAVKGQGSSSAGPDRFLTLYLVAPLSWEHHLIFVLPTVFLALAHVFSRQDDWRRTLWVAVPAFLISWPIHLDNAGWERHVFHLFLSLKFYAVLAL